MDAVSRRLNFDRLAKPYRWLEYLTFGRMLERCRFHSLPALVHAKRALILGDGDGRFLARLLAVNPALQADVVDISPAMLRLLEERLRLEDRQRVTLHQADARSFVPPEKAYDLVVTHFFLDCLFEPEVADLVQRVTTRLSPDARWVVSEFALPHTLVGKTLGKTMISGLYQAFGLTTGLQVRALPDHAAALQGAGFEQAKERQWLGGLLISQQWQRNSSQSMQPFIT
jgi:ubiquinone/menaquinone biosynthesis C-methylase UbiE